MNLINRYESNQKKFNAFKIVVERDRNVAPKFFTNGKYINYYIRIFIDYDRGQKEGAYTFEDVSMVKYELDPSYREPIRTSENRATGFDINVWSYGFYPVKATIYLMLGEPIVLVGFVKFETT